VDFDFSPKVKELQGRVTRFMEQNVYPVEHRHHEEVEANRARGNPWVALKLIDELKEKARAEGLWNLWRPVSHGGTLTNLEYAPLCEIMGAIHWAPEIFNCSAPDTGNMETILRYGSPAHVEQWAKPLLEGKIRSCFAMTEPEVAGSDPTLIQTRAVLDGDSWVVNGHKWFISGASGAQFAILIARTEDNPEIPQAANSAFLVDLPSPGWTVVRDVVTMAGHHNHAEIRIENLRVPRANLIGEPGQGHLLGQARLGPARLAHCMRWIGQAEVALDMMVDRSLNRFAHGSLLAEKQGIQWMIADSAMELYQCKLMVLHAAYRIDRKEDFRSEVSMAKHFVANALNRIIDRAIQVHGALGYSTDTPLAMMAQQARWARFADGADEVHQWRIAQRTIDAYKKHKSTKTATGNLPL